MKPIKLELCNFGPFVSTVTIDFKDLDQFFLVSGKTGSGKSTLFDGIVFALYGKVPGSRDEASLKSHYAEAEAIPEVLFQFSLHGKLYKIIRSAKFERQKKRGDGIISVPQSVKFYKHEQGQWNLFTEKSLESNREIEELLGLSFDEFQKVILLPQGDFMRFLEENSSKRKEILEKLFPIEKHSLVLDAVKLKASEKEAELKLLEQRLQDIEQKLTDEEYAAQRKSTEEKLTDLINNIDTVDLELESFHRQLSSLEEKKTKLQEYLKCMKEIQTLETQAESIFTKKKQIADLKAVKAIFPIYHEFERLNIELKEQSNDLHTLKKQDKIFQEQQKELFKNIEEVEDLKEKLKSDEEQLFKLNLHKNKAEEIPDLQQNQTKLKILINSLLNDIQKLNKEICEDEKQLTRLDVQSEDLQAFERRIKDLQIGIAEIEKEKERALEKETLQQILHEQNEEQHSLNEQSNACKKRTEMALSQLKIFLNEEKAYFAGELAESLEADQPCPVCGSTTHPQPASHTDNKIFQEAKKTANEQWLECENEVVRIHEKLQWLEKQQAENTKRIKQMDDLGSVHDLQKKLFQKQAACSKEESLLDSLKDQRVKYEQVRKGLDEKKARLLAVTEKHNATLQNLSSVQHKLETVLENILPIKTFSEFCQTINALTNEIQKNQLAYDSFEEKQEQLKDKLLQIRTSISDKEKTLSLLQTKHETSLQHLQKAMLEFDTDLKNIAFQAKQEQQAETWKDEVTQFENSMLELKTRAAQLSQDSDSYSEDIHNTCITALDNKKLERKQLDEQKTKLINELENLEQVHIKYTNLQTELEKKGKSANKIIQLARLLSGHNIKKLPFPNFVLSMYLQEIVTQANLRLETLSEDRYILLTNTDKTVSNSYSGLDLDILDRYTGQQRSVKTLSGGEKFLASISLALGLADAIQQRNGGIQLDSIFIDEGFGSLDEQALDKAITILDDLRESRCIGIISHVSELKNRIPSKILVNKHEDGSRISVKSS